MSAVIALVLVLVVVALLFWVYGGNENPTAARDAAGSRVTVSTHQNLGSALHLVEKKAKSAGLRWDKLIAMVALVGGPSGTLRKSKNISQDVLVLWAMRGGNQTHVISSAVQSAWPIYQQMLEGGLASEWLTPKTAESPAIEGQQEIPDVDTGQNSILSPKASKSNIGSNERERVLAPSHLTKPSPTLPVWMQEHIAQNEAQLPNEGDRTVVALCLRKRPSRLLAWAQEKIAEKGAGVAAKEMTRYINFLRGADDEDIAMILLFTSLARENLLPQNYEEQCLSSKLGGFPPDPDVALGFQGELVRTYKQLQRADYLEMASALAVWAHTNRAFCYPEVRYLGRELWAELSRGFAHLESCANDLRTLGVSSIPDRVLSGARNIPLALRPKE